MIAASRSPGLFLIALLWWGAAARAADELTLSVPPEALRGYVRQDNGTVIDRSTGLVWLADPTCLGNQTWQAALDTARTFSAERGARCGLKDGSQAGDWRLPNINELTTLTDFGARGPAIERGNPIKIGRTDVYWSSSYMARDKARVWKWEALDGHVRPRVKSAQRQFILVRDARVEELPLIKVDRAELSRAKRIHLASAEGLKTLVVTGQTDCYDAGGIAVSCKDTGQDGEYQRGFRVAGARFSDRGDGTVLDRYTEHVVLKDPKCLRRATWDEGMAHIAALANGACGIQDGSKPGDWRNFSAYEFQQLLAWDRGGPGIASLPAGHPFKSIATFRYWTSTKCAFKLSGQVCGWAFSTEGEVSTDDAGPNGQTRWFWALRRDEPAQQVLDCTLSDTRGAADGVLTCKRYGKQVRLRVQSTPSPS